MQALTIEQAAERLGVGRRRVSALVRSGRFPGAYRVPEGHILRVYIPAAEVEAFVRRPAGRPRGLPVKPPPSRSP